MLGYCCMKSASTSFRRRSSSGEDAHPIKRRLPDGVADCAPDAAAGCAVASTLGVGVGCAAGAHAIVRMAMTLTSTTRPAEIMLLFSFGALDTERGKDSIAG